MRKSIASDRFYEGDPLKLYSQVKHFLVKCECDDIKMVIVPHGGYIYSGKCLGEVYSRMKEKVETVILLAHNHSDLGPQISMYFESFLIPFGKIENDFVLGKLILKNSLAKGLSAKEFDESHENDSSLEVQLPFVTIVFGNSIKIVPILLKDLSYDNCLKFAKVLKDSINASGKDVKVIISSDFSHYGEFYNSTPFFDNVKERMHYLDKKAIDYILNFDAEKFYTYSSENTTICGIAPITVGLEFANLSNYYVAEKVCYYNSGDITKDYSNCVNYAGIAFR